MSKLSATDVDELVTMRHELLRLRNRLITQLSSCTEAISIIDNQLYSHGSITSNLAIPSNLTK